MNQPASRTMIKTLAGMDANGKLYARPRTLRAMAARGWCEPPTWCGYRPDGSDWVSQITDAGRTEAARHGISPPAPSATTPAIDGGGDTADAGDTAAGGGPLTVQAHRLFVGGTHLLDTIRRSYSHLPLPYEITIFADGCHQMTVGDSYYTAYSMWAIGAWAHEFDAPARLCIERLPYIETSVTIAGLAVHITVRVFAHQMSRLLWALDHDGVWLPDHAEDPPGHSGRPITREVAGAELIAVMMGHDQMTPSDSSRERRT